MFARLGLRHAVLGMGWSIGLAVTLLSASPARAQNWSFDARNVALGGVGSTSNVAADMVDEQRKYRAIVLPFGLVQILPNLPKVDPTKDDFDFVRAVEYAISPIHYIVGRDTTNSGQQFMTDLRNGELNRDLNTYRGFVPDTDIAAEGLASPSWGKTFKFRKRTDGSFQGIYAGAGPYFAVNTSANIDPALADLLSSPTPIYVPNAHYYMTSDTQSQLALAITGGYRARLAWANPSAGAPSLDGLYVGANYHYLRGFAYERFQPDARLDTNAQGLLVVDPKLGLPVTITRTTTDEGRGFAVDVGVSAVRGPWQVGLGVNGIANRIEWRNVEQTNYVLDSLFNGGEFEDLPTVPVGDVKLELPVDVRANGTYDADTWTALAEYGHGYNGSVFRGGYEYRLSRYQFRGGGRYITDRWEATGGVGVNLSKTFGVDVGLFSTSANIERKRHMAIAVSVRFMHGKL